MDVIIRGNRLRLNPNSSNLIGSGGEAEIFDIGNGEVAKIFKPSNHADFSGNHDAQKAAEYRIAEHQIKLRAWPKNLPSSVIGPTSLVTDVQGKNVVGYTMRFLSGMEVLLKYGERKYCETHGVTGDRVVEIFHRLHELVGGVHTNNVVIGDFNDLNVLVDASLRTHLVDADSMQFGGFMSRVFTARFVDPLLCDGQASSASLRKPHNVGSDWYAYHVMLMQSLLYVGPYGGVHAPADVTKKLKEWQRVQKRVTVFDQSVRYPKPALHFSILPDAVLQQFHKVFEKDARGEFPFALLKNIRFTVCPLCKKVHARANCPDCQPISPSIIKEVISGSVEAMKILETSGRIIFATVQDGVVKYVYHESEIYFREGKHKVVDGKADPEIRFRINGDSTILAKAGQGIIIDRDGAQKRFVADLFRGRATVFDANGEYVFVAEGDTLKRFKTSNLDYADTLGMIISGQTMVWVSKKLGFVYGRAGGITRSYVFHTNEKNLGQEVDIGRVTGQILDATAVFSDDYVWFLMSIDENGQRLNRVYMFDQFGKACGQAETAEGDGSWLGSIRGKCAVGKQLFSPTDDGIVRVEQKDGVIGVTKVFSDTSRFADSSSKILFAKDGIYVVEASRIWRLRMK